MEESRRLFTLFLNALQEGLFDKIGPARGLEVWSPLYSVSEKHPDWTCEAIGIMLRRAWHRAKSQGHLDPFAEQVGVFADRVGDEARISRAYQEAPLNFLREVWSTFIEIVRSNLLAEGNPPFSDTVWRWHLPTTTFRFRDKLINGIQDGIRALARVNFPCFLQLAKSAESHESATIDNILVCGFGSAASDHPDEAISFLLEDTARLLVGWHSDREGPARELIQRASVACNEDLLNELETLVLNHYPVWERSLSGRASYGRSQYALLSAIERARRSPEVAKRLQEWERKFRPYVSPLVNDRRGGIVGSPIPQSAAILMTDEQWLSAIERYSTNGIRTMPDGSVVGGAGTVANQLGTQTKKTPGRFVELIHRIPKTRANSVYFDHILMGVSGSSVSVERVIAACHVADELPGKPCGQAICHCLESFASNALPSTAIELVSRYCGDSFHDYTRKAAFFSLANLFFASRARIEDAIDCLRVLLPKLPRSLLPEFCYCLTPLLGTPYRGDAVHLFLRTWEGDPWLPTDRLVEHFLLYVARLDYSSIRPILKILLQSDEPEMRQSASRAVAGAALFDCDARELVEKIAEGDKQQRQGLAQVCAANLVHTGFSDFCEGHLLVLFDDNEADVREAASECFEYFTGEHIAEYPRLVARFLESPALEADSNRLLHALAQSTIRHDSVTLSASKRSYWARTPVPMAEVSITTI